MKQLNREQQPSGANVENQSFKIVSSCQVSMDKEIQFYQNGNMQNLSPEHGSKAFTIFQNSYLKNGNGSKKSSQVNHSQTHQNSPAELIMQNKAKFEIIPLLSKQGVTDYTLMNQTGNNGFHQHNSSQIISTNSYQYMSGNQEDSKQNLNHSNTNSNLIKFDMKMNVNQSPYNELQVNKKQPGSNEGDNTREYVKNQNGTGVNPPEHAFNIQKSKSNSKSDLVSNKQSFSQSVKNGQIIDFRDPSSLNSTSTNHHHHNNNTNININANFGNGDINQRMIKSNIQNASGNKQAQPPNSKHRKNLSSNILFSPQYYNDSQSELEIQNGQNKNQQFYHSTKGNPNTTMAAIQNNFKNQEINQYFSSLTSAANINQKNSVTNLTDLQRFENFENSRSKDILNETPGNQSVQKNISQRDSRNEYAIATPPSNSMLSIEGITTDDPSQINPNSNNFYFFQQGQINNHTKSKSNGNLNLSITNHKNEQLNNYALNSTYNSTKNGAINSYQMQSGINSNTVNPNNNNPQNGTSGGFFVNGNPSLLPVTLQVKKNQSSSTNFSSVANTTATNFGAAGGMYNGNNNQSMSVLNTSGQRPSIGQSGSFVYQPVVNGNNDPLSVQKRIEDVLKNLSTPSENLNEDQYLEKIYPMLEIMNDLVKSGGSSNNNEAVLKCRQVLENIMGHLKQSSQNYRLIEGKYEGLKKQYEIANNYAKQLKLKLESSEKQLASVVPSPVKNRPTAENQGCQTSVQDQGEIPIQIDVNTQKENQKILQENGQLKQFVLEIKKKYEAIQEKEKELIKLVLAIQQYGVDVDEIYNRDVINKQNEDEDADEDEEETYNLPKQKQKHYDVINNSGYLEADESIVNDNDNSKYELFGRLVEEDSDISVIQAELIQNFDKSMGKGGKNLGENIQEALKLNLIDLNKKQVEPTESSQSSKAPEVPQIQKQKLKAKGNFT